MKKLSFFLMAMLMSVMSFAAEINLDFTKIDGFSSWNNSYTTRVVEYDEATVTFTSANRQTSTIDNQPVTKGQPVTVVMKNNATLSGVKFVCTQWGTKAQTITLHYSVDGGKTYTSTGITSTTFNISSEELPLGTNAVKLTFSSSSNQIGIASCTLVTVDANPDAPKYMVTATPSDEAMGTVTGGGEYGKGSVVTLTATPNAGYKFVNWSNGSTDNPLVLEVTEDVNITANFAAKDVYTITWSVNGETTTTSVVEGEALVLPEAPEAPEACSEKVFVGWTTAEEVNADGSNITWVDETVIPTNSVTYYAVFATVEGEEAQETSITKTVKEYAEANSWANETQYKTMVIDENITITITEEGTYHNSGKYYLNGNTWRFYQNESPAITFSAQKGSINSIAMVYAIKNTGVLTHNSTNIASGEVYTVNNSSVTFNVGNTGTATNGNIQVTEITVVYTAQVNIYTDYSTTCEAEPELEVMDIEMTNLVVEEMEGFLVLTASDDENTGLNVMLALNADGTLNTEVSYMALIQGWNETELPIVEGAITKTYNEELATDVYTGLIVVEYMEGKLGLNLTMYAKPVVVTDVVVTDATITVETGDDGMGGTYEMINVTANWNESVLKLEGVEKEFNGFLQITETFVVDGEEDWYIWMCMNGVITTVDNVLTVTGEFKNNYTGDVYNVTISGKLPVVKPTTITYELNGGEIPAVVVPTNAELWEAFKPYYNTYYGLARADQPIDKVSTFAAAKMQEIMTDEASEYKWLGDYVQSVATAAGVPLSTDMASANEGGWRWAVHAFFNAAAGQYGATGIDFTEAGKPEAWGAAYEAEYGVVLPTEPVAEDYTLPTPTKEGYTFVGWYDNAEGTGEAYKVIPAGWAGTLYAIWKANGPTTDLDNIAVEGKAVKAIINGQVLIMIGDKTFNMMGQQVK